jgi:hypothetical protein
MAMGPALNGNLARFNGAARVIYTLFSETETEAKLNRFSTADLPSLSISHCEPSGGYFRQSGLQFREGCELSPEAIDERVGDWRHLTILERAGELTRIQDLGKGVYRDHRSSSSGQQRKCHTGPPFIRP